MTRTNEHGQPIGEPVDWSTRERPERIVLPGRHVRLEPVTTAHATALFAALGPEAADPLWTYRPDHRPADVDELTARIEGWASASESLTWAVVPTGAEAQGLVSLFRIDPANGSAEVAAVLYGPRLQRTTAATEAVVLLGRYLFDDLAYRRYEWKCDSLNEPSRRAATRLGFGYEGRFVNALVYRGRNRDTDWFSITDAEWPARRAAYDAWLDPDNFDAAGRQRRPLVAGSRA